jgi:hypothetical protein
MTSSCWREIFSVVYMGDVCRCREFGALRVDKATAPLTVTAGSWYAIRLEAIGDALRAYVNGRLLLEARDSTFVRGSYGAVMYKAAARYDDFKAVQP